MHTYPGKAGSLIVPETCLRAVFSFVNPGCWEPKSWDIPCKVSCRALRRRYFWGAPASAAPSPTPVTSDYGIPQTPSYPMSYARPPACPPDPWCWLVFIDLPVGCLTLLTV